jgi:RND family efflux transporter MFP subunit
MNPLALRPAGRIVALACVAALLAACGSRGKAEPAAAPSLTVTPTQATQRTLPRAIVASGSVAAWQEMSLGVELSGLRVAEVLVEPGTRVKAGQPLVRLDARTLDVQARQAEASVQQAQASLEVARSSARRGEQLLAQNLISSSNADDLRANLRKAEAALVSAEAERDAARLRLSFATLRAPDDGIISARSVQPGQVVQPGAELLRLIRRGRLEWRAELPDADLLRVQPGSAVELQSPTGETVTGKIRAISPSVGSQTRTALIYADLPENAGLRAGMFAQGRIMLGEAPAWVVPRESVVFRDGYSYVFVIGKDSRVEQRRIQTGSQDGTAVEVRAGLKPGERVVSRGAGFLSEGDLVRVVPAQGG